MNIAPHPTTATRSTRIGAGPDNDLLVRMRADIVSNTISPMARLKFADMTARYGVGIGTLREALSHLLSEGFVTLDRGRGFRVAAASVEDLDDITAHFRELETRAVMLSIRHAGPEWEREVAFRIDLLDEFLAMHPTPDLGDNVLWIAHHKAFYDAIVAACPSHWLRKMRGMLFDQLDRYRFLTLIHRKTLSARPHAHRTVAEAALARDAERAAALVREHIEGTAANARRYLGGTG